jgi:hypothetical protein
VAIVPNNGNPEIDFSHLPPADHYYLDSDVAKRIADIGDP